jgi:hypothetical protein
MSALQEIFRLAEADDPYRSAPKNLYELQLEAARERVVQRRKQIRLLDRRAQETGIDEVRRPKDLVTLLFADSNYKSYPDSFIDQGRWDRMTLWLQTLSANPITGMNHAGIRDMDDWVAELRRNDQYVMSSSGTSGKQSFLNQSAADREWGWKLMIQGLKWSIRNFREKSKGYPVFALLPSGGSYTATERVARFIDAVGAPDDVHYLSYVPQSAQEMATMGKLRREMAAGTAKPSELADFEAKSKARQALIQKDVAAFMERLCARHREPMLMTGMMATLYAVVLAARKRGIGDGEFNEKSVISIGGGRKGSNLPEDFEEQCHKFFNLGEHNFQDGYGMAEMSGFCPLSHKTGGWAIPPWIMPLLLDKEGENLVSPENGQGTAEGRFAFIDLLVDGRWGGVISGDKLTIEFNPNDDGVRTPIARGLIRYKDLPGDDKATCAGTIDSYIRGMIADAA